MKGWRSSFLPQYRTGANTPFRVRVSELQRHLGARIHSSLLVMSKQLRQKKNNDPFLQLQLADVTGQVTANIWNNAVEADKRFESGHVLEIVGLITTYQDRLQITIERLRRVRQTEINLADCPPGTTGEPDEFAPSNAVYSEPGQWLPTDDNTVQSAMAERATARRAQELAAKYARDGPESPEEARQLQENYKGRREGWKGTGRR